MKKLLIIAAFIGIGFAAGAQNAAPTKGKETTTVQSPTATKEASVANANATTTKETEKKDCSSDKKSCGDMKKSGHSCCSGKAKSEK